MIYVIEFEAYLSYDYKKECVGTAILEGNELTEDDMIVLINREINCNDYICKAVNILETKKSFIPNQVIHISYNKRE